MKLPLLCQKVVEPVLGVVLVAIAVLAPWLMGGAKVECVLALNAIGFIFGFLGIQ